MAYTGKSVVDYLKSVGKPSDYASRSALASQYGITGYTGSAGQNTSLLSKLMGGSTPATSIPTAAVNVPVSSGQSISTYKPPVTSQGISLDASGNVAKPLTSANTGLTNTSLSSGINNMLNTGSALTLDASGNIAKPPVPSTNTGLTNTSLSINQPLQVPTTSPSDAAKLAAISGKVSTANSGISPTGSSGQTGGATDVVTGAGTGGNGENIGDAGEIIKPAGTGGTDIQSILTAIQNALGTSSTATGQSDAQKALTEMLTKMGGQFDAYSTALANQPTAEATYEKYRNLLGLPEQEAQYTTAQKAVMGTQQLISDTENLITKLESDINTRIGGLSSSQPVLEAQRRRLLASEQKPLTEQVAGLTQTLGKQTTAAGMEGADVSGLKEQLTQMLNLSGQTEAQKIAAAKAPLEYGTSMLPTLTSMAEYQTPAEKLSQSIASEQLQKSLGLGNYAVTPTATKLTTIGSDETGYYSFNPSTGETKKITSGTGTSVWSTPVVDKTTNKVTQTNSKTGEVRVVGDVGAGSTTGLDATAANTLSSVNELLNMDLESMTGLTSLPANALFGTGKVAKTKLDLLTNLLAMNARSLIKGSGSISDKETEMLRQSQSILSTFGLPKEALRQELTRIKGILRQNAGESVKVKVVNGNQSHETTLNREDVYSALQQGYQVIYL
jgi:hypothetical protein